MSQDRTSANKPALSALRRHRLHRCHGLRAQGLTSAAVGRRLGIAPTTVRDYWNDPLRVKARARQAQLGVAGGGTVAKKWRRGGPHQGTGARHARVRAVQLGIIRGHYARKGR